MVQTALPLQPYNSADPKIFEISVRRKDAVYSLCQAPVGDS